MQRELPEGWEWKRLGDILKECYRYPTYFGIEYVSDGIPEVRGELLLKNGKISLDTKKYRYISKKTADLFPRVKLEEGDLILSVRGTIGKIGTVPKGLEGGVITANLIRLSPLKEKVDSNYLKIFLLTKKFQEYLNSQCSSTTIKTIQAPVIKALKIPLPPLQVQRQIVAVLEQAGAVKRQRQEADALTGALLQSIFLEMFGDPVKNEMGWESKQLDEVCPLIRDGEHRTPTYIDEGIPFITAKNLVGNRINFENTDKISPKEHIEFSKRAKPELGDLLMTKDGTIGVTQVIKEDIEFSIYVSVVLLKLNHKIIHPDFLNYLLSSDEIQNEIRKRTKGIAIRHIHLIDLRSLKIPLPPFALQQQFASIVEHVERIRDQQVASRKEIEGLCEGLMQRAFAGELVA